jgi:diguanylate cyclase (GGDEF)-like protein
MTGMDQISVRKLDYDVGLSHITLAKLPYADNAVKISSTLFETTEIFKLHPFLPGVIVLDGDTCIGMISRDKCFETLGRPFGVELYLKHPLSNFIKAVSIQALILPEKTPIREAVNKALQRSTSELYDPIIVSCSRRKEYRLIDMRTLLKAQSEILADLVIEVEKLSILDPLTGLLNRRGFFSQSLKCVEHARTNELDIAVLLVDIDHFKNVNDIYGHQIGDIVLQNVAMEFMRTIRETDITGRFGGEEFMGMLSDVSEEEAFAIADRFRNRIESLVIQTDFYNISVTVSVGVCHINSQSTGIESLFSRADKALYEAKVNGRNRVVLWKNSSLYSHQCPPPASTSGSIEIYSDHRLQVYDDTVESWARALEMRDHETKGHAERVVTLSVRMAELLGLNHEDCENIRRGALLHDIGKIAIPDSILFKQGKLSPEEWEIMKQHPVYAYNFIAPVKVLSRLLDIPYCHHEHWDGSGYPRGLSGKNIPISARIFTLVDVWDALTSDRCYRPAWTHESALEYIKEQSGQLFDPELVPIFTGMIIQDPVLQITYPQPELIQE